MEVPGERPMFAVDFQRIKCLMTPRIPGCLEGGQRSVPKPRQECAGVIDPHLLFFAGQLMFPLLDESLGNRRDRIDFAVQPDGRVDTVSQQITCHTASGHVYIQAPTSRTTLWYLG